MSHDIYFYESNFFYLSISFTKIKNNNLNFDKFIKNYKAISHKSSQDVYKEFNNIRDSPYPYIANEYIIEQTFKKFKKNCKPYLFIYIFF